MKINKYFIGIICSIAIIYFVVGPSAQAANITQSDESTTSFAKSVKTNGFLTVIDDNSIAIVNGWTITQADLTNRINEYNELGKEASNTEIMDVLFEEAVLYAQAEELGILPTDVEIQQYLSVLLADKNISQVIQNIKTANDSLEYYAFKFLAYTNVYNYYLNKGRELGFITTSYTYDEENLK